TSTLAPSAPRCTSRSVASRKPATVTARPARPPWTCSRSGSPSTSTTPARSSARRSTTSSGRQVSRVKLVWFVPADALEATRDAVFEAGGGRIGEYTRCSWYTAGTGTFLGGEGAAPAVGETGRE